MFHVTTRTGSMERAPTVERMRAVLAELDRHDPEHPCVSLTHESEWCLGAYPSGLLVWEHLVAGRPRHRNAVSREEVLALWIKLAEGRIADIEAEPWLPGYVDAPLERT